MSQAHTVRHDRDREAPPREPSIWGVVSIAVAVFLGGLLVAGVLQNNERRALRLATESELAAVTSEVEQRLGEQTRALERFARDWERRQAKPRGAWEATATELVDDFGDIQAIEWVDADFHVRWIVPLEGNEPALGLDLGFEERRRAALEVARDRHEVIVSSSVRLVQGGQGFLVYVPLFPNGSFDGFVLGVYRAEASLSAILQNLATDYDVSVAEGPDVLFSRVLPDSPASEPVTAPARVRNQTWTVRVSPGAAVQAMYLTPLPLVVILLGALLGAGMAVTSYVAFLLRVRNYRLRAEVERRRKVEDELSMVVDALPDHVWSGLQSGRRVESTYFSPVIERITGHPSNRFHDHPELWPETVHDADRDRVRRAHGEFLRGDRDAFSIEYRIVTLDGEVRWVRERVRATRVAAGRRLDGVTSDITEIKSSEEERLRLEATVQTAQKVESLGVLAGGIAHDFNNLLMGVLGSAEVVFEDLPSYSPMRSHVDRIRRAAQSAADLCRQMLAFAGQGSIELARLDLRERIVEMADLLAAATSKKISVEYDFAGALPLVEADPSQIHQVVLNLMTNASEAIGDRRGTITVAASSRDLGSQEIGDFHIGQQLVPGHYVSLRVRDDGCGMDTETLHRFLEPYYTTKFSGRGLGMAAVHGIVRRHRGGMLVESAPGRGTLIEVFLPALAERIELKSPPPSPPKSPEVTGSVLLVDDDEYAREVGSIFLERAGFSVLLAIDGEEAIQLLGQQHADEVVCVLLDLTMPRLDGRETLMQIRAIDTSLPVVLCSGYREEETMKRFTGLGLAGFLQKPYTPEALIEVLSRALTPECDAGR